MTTHALDDPRMTANRIKEIFVSATERDSPEARRAYLDEACNGDASVRQRVEALLAAHDAPESVLDEAAVASPRPDATADVGPREAKHERPGSVIDRYKLLQELGEGGFGIVYMAEQQEPVRRQVALKIIKPGMDTREVVARFEAERQALALMDHPNIARVLDAGATGSGRPYFVMELVKGVPITEFCDKNNCSTRERLELFIEVCRAVQHAHQKGIIHRDLKPSNVMITLHDGKPVPKVIDFGVSKAINQRLTEKTLFTHYGQMVGTPQYMSPEQAEMSGLDVDTRSDIYSLGVLLYELLTGTTPLDRQRLHSAGYAEMLRIIQNEEPPMPSTRLTTLRDELTVVCKHRSTDARRLGQLLAGDLDWIVMKALEKDRGRRYDTANGLAADIVRHLADEPVVAGPPSAAYRLRKFARRNRGLVASAAAVVFAGLTIATIGYLQVAKERDRAIAAEQKTEEARETAVKERDIAQETEAKTRVVINLLNEMLGAANPDSVKGPDYTVRQLIDDFSQGLDERLAGQPEVEAELRLTLGRAYSTLGQTDQANDHLQRSLELRRQAFGGDHEQVAEVMVALAEHEARPHASLFSFASAEKHARDAIEIYDGVEIELPGRAAAHNVLGIVSLVIKKHYAKAESHFRDALRIARAISAGKDTDLVARSLSLLAWSIAAQRDGREADADALARQAIAIYEQTLGGEHPATLAAIDRQGACFAEQEKWPEAEASFRRAWQAAREKFGATDAGVLFFANNLTHSLVDQQRHIEALKVCDEVIAACRAQGKQDALPQWLYAAGSVHLDREDFGQAEKCFREAEAIPLAPIESDITAGSRFYLARILRDQGREAEAQRLFQEVASAAKLWSKSPFTNDIVLYAYAYSLLHRGADDRDSCETALEAAKQALELSMRDRTLRREGIVRHAIAVAQYKLGDVREAIGSLRAGLEAMPAGLHDHRRELEATLARYLQEEGDVPAAEAVYRDGVAKREEFLPAGHPLIATAEIRLGAFLREQKRYDDAEAVLLQAEESLRDNPEAVEANRQNANEQLVRLYNDWGKPDEAAQWQSSK
jgi:serine/threonine protein kinase/tetratricopeptide (TPR) repeat protein